MSSDQSSSEVSQLIDAVREGDDVAADALMTIVYGELRGLAQAIYAEQRRQHSLQPTALVHEAWMKLASHINSMDGRRHFLAVAAKAMRQVLADHARAASRIKRGGARRTVTLIDEPAGNDGQAVDIIMLDDCLARLAEMNDRVARVVELRLLGAMTVDEIAESLDVSARTVDADWQFARAWLRRELSAD